jgi:Rho-binding antiterminator
MARERDYVPISCADYEILETACIDRYAVEIITDDGRTVAGRALDLKVRSPEEFLVVLHDDGTTEDVRVDQIRYMSVLSRQRRFDHHAFAIQFTPGA